jgi:hypothetical protein
VNVWVVAWAAAFEGQSVLGVFESKAAALLAHPDAVEVARA